MASVTVRVEAEDEYEAALAWYAARSAQAASGFVAAFDAAIEAVAAAPEAYPFCDDDHRRCQLRRYPYALVYRVEQPRVFVVAVPHDRQLGGFWAGRA